MSRSSSHPFPDGQIHLSDEEKSAVRKELRANIEAAMAALDARGRKGLHPRVKALRSASQAPDVAP